MIGAGIAGINAGILLPIKVPGIELTIFEKNKDVVSLIIPSFKVSGRLVNRSHREVLGSKMSTQACG